MNLAFLAQDAPAQPAGRPPGSPLGGILDMLPMLLVIWLIFYFLVFRPQKKERQALKEKLEGLEKGDEVRTRGGLLGVVASVKEGEVLLRIDTDGKVRVRVAKEFVEDVVPKGRGSGKGDTKK